MITYEDQMKCMGCRLHFTIYSNTEPERDQMTVYCPECGRRQASIRLNQNIHPDTFVFQLIPKRRAEA